MLRPSQQQLRHFLTEELGISPRELQLSLRRAPSHSGYLPMVLWQYGFIDLTQLERVFDWLEGLGTCG